jgi:cell division protein FtsL
VFLLTIVTAGALAHVGVRLKSLEVAYDLGRERRIATDLEEQRRRLQIEIGMLKDPRRVIALARTKLNMGPPAPEAIWRLGSGAPLGDTGSRSSAATNPKAIANVATNTNSNTNTNAKANSDTITNAGSGPRASRLRRGPR